MPWIVGAVLAIPIAMLVQLGVTEWLDQRLNASIEISAARKLAVLAGAAEKYVHANYGTLIDAANPASQEIATSTLSGQDFLPDGFGAGDAMKRGLKVWMLRSGDRLRVATMQEVAADDDRWPGSGVFEARGAQHLGIVDEAGILRGPTVNEDITAFQADAGGDPKRYALAIVQEFDRESVCGDYLYRRARDGCPNSGRMERDLDLNGNDLIGVGSLEAGTLEVSDGITIEGDFRIDGELAVGRAVRVEGTFAVPGGLSFDGDAEFTGRVNANEVEVTGSLEAASADIGQAVTAANITAGGNLTTPGVTATSVTAASGQIRSLTVGSCTGC